MTTETTRSVDEVLADLEREWATLDPDRVRREAEAAVVKVQQHASALDARIHTIRTTHVMLVSIDGKLATEHGYLDTLTTIRAQLCTELLALPKRIYDAPTRALSNQIEVGIKSLDFGLLCDWFQLNTTRLGQLLKEAGYTEGPKQDGQTFGEMFWGGSIPECERRIKALEAQRADAQARLDEALLTDEQRAAKLATVAEVNAKPRRKVRGDGSVYLQHKDGRIEEIEVSD